MVKRWNYVDRQYAGQGFEVSEAGQWVLASDYDALAARLAEVERQRDVLLDFAEMVADGQRGDCDCWVCELARQAKEAIADTRDSSVSPYIGRTMTLDGHTAVITEYSGQSGDAMTRPPGDVDSAR